jgi:hypothetical protein
VTDDFVEGPVVEELNEFRIGFLQGGLVVGKQFLVVPDGGFREMDGFFMAVVEGPS